MLAGFGACIVLTVTVCTLAYTQLQTITATATRVTKDTMPSIYLMGKVQSSTLLGYALLMDHVNAESKEEKAQLEGRIDSVDGEVENTISRYEALVNDTEDRQLFEALKTAMMPYRQCHLRVLHLSRGGNRAVALNLIKSQLVPLRKVFFEAAEAEVEWNKADADDSAKAIMAAVNWT